MFRMYGMVHRIFENTITILSEYLEQNINGRILGAFISKDIMELNEVEEWIQGQEKDLFMATGFLKGLLISQPWLFIPFYYYTRAQGIATCYYKLHWNAKTYVVVEENVKTEKKTSSGFCTCLEAPILDGGEFRLSMWDFCYPTE